MIITCPACATRYLTDPMRLGPSGRDVRCVKCGHRWTQMPPADMPRRVDIEPPPAAPAEAADGASHEGIPTLPSLAHPPIVPPAPRSGGGAGLAALLLVILVLSAGALYFGRYRIVAAWPDAARLYALASVDAQLPGQGLELSNVTVTRSPTEAGDLLVIRADIFNAAETPRPMPALTAVLRGPQGRPLRQMLLQIDRPEIQPGERASFSTTTRETVPTEATRISLGFAYDPAGS